MAKYEVQLHKTLSTVVTVEADSEEQAIERAFDSDDMPGGICARCSGWGRKFSVDDGEWDVPSEEDCGDQPVKRVSE